MPSRIQIGRLIRWMTLLVLAGAFGWSGLVKVLDPEGFALSVYRYHLLPHAAVNAVSLWIAWLELACAVILLLIPRLRTSAQWLLLSLLITFSLAIIVNLIRGSQMACGCFSTSSLAHPIGWLGLLKNLGLMLLSFYWLGGRN